MSGFTDATKTLYEEGFAAFGERVSRITCRSSNIKGVSSRSRRKSRRAFLILNPMRKKQAKRERRKKSDLENEKECDRALVEQIRRLLALRMNQRTHFLRVRHPTGGPHLKAVLPL
jgi:hypothetical protein